MKGFFKITILDIYIIKKFLSTYIFTIILIISIAVVFDINERFQKFSEPSWHAIIFDYYLSFIPFYANTFSALFVFISVIFFTSKLADNSEIIAMLAAGISFSRLMKPYMLSAAIIAACSFYLGSFVIPPANAKRINFQNRYFRDKSTSSVSEVHVKLDDNTIFYINNYTKHNGTGRNLSLDQFDDKSLKSRLIAERAKYDSNNVWTLTNYSVREFGEDSEHIIMGTKKDTLVTIPITPSDLLVNIDDYEIMQTPELYKYIHKQKARGLTNVGAVNLTRFEVEYNKRFSSIFSAFILTIIGVSLSSRKIKGGMGLNILIGFILSFGYIVFDTISSSFAISGAMSPFFAVWLPNIVFIIIATFLYRKAPN